MQPLLDGLLSHAGYGLLLLVLLLAGLGLPFPEDVALLAAGVMVHRGLVELVPTLAVCAVGVLAGDTLIYCMARALGPAALKHRWMVHVLPPARRAKLEQTLARHGGKMVFVARHIAGLRAPFFALAGMHHMPYPTFLMWDGLGLCVSGPLLVGLGALSAQHLDLVLARLGRLEHYSFLMLAGGFAIAATVLVWRRWRGRP